jgi:hypothetical protein
MDVNLLIKGRDQAADSGKVFERPSRPNLNTIRSDRPDGISSCARKVSS